MIKVSVQREDGTVENESFDRMETMLYWAFEFKEVPFILSLTMATGAYPTVVDKPSGPPAIKTSLDVVMGSGRS